LAKRRKKIVRKPEPKFNVNRNIGAQQIRLVGDNLTEVSEAAGKTVESGIFPTPQVLNWARDMELDLVEISPNAEPPVCKITDFKKFLYEKKKKDKAVKAKTAKTVVKEIRFGPNTDDHDFNFKLKHAQKFLTDGAKVKAYVHFRGRSIVFKDRGELLLLRLLNELADYGAAEELPKLEGRRMIVIVTPKKNKK